MRIHLQRHHGNLFEQLVNREADRDTAETQQSSQAEVPRSTGINNQTERPSQAVADIPRSTAINNNQMEQSSEAVVHLPRSVGISRQTSIQRRHSLRASPYSRPVKTFDKNDPFMQGFKAKLVGFVAKDLQPLSVVEDSGFIDLMEYVEPKLKLPSRSTLTHSWLPDIYETEKSKLKSLLASVEFVSLTCDLWSSIAHESKLTVTCHFIDSNFHLHSKVLETISMPERHTSLNLATRLTEISNNWGIKTKIVCVVTDNAANIVNAINECDWRHIPCYAHTLNLAVKDALQDADNVRALFLKCRELVGFFHRSSRAASVLKQQCEVDRRITRRTLIQDVETRWNSSVYMLSSILTLKMPVMAALGMLEKSSLAPDQDEWVLLGELLRLLVPFEHVTTELCGQYYTTISKVSVLSFVR